MTNTHSGLDSLGQEKLSTLYARLIIPMSIGMIINGLYNLVDAYFVANFIGENAFAAVSTIFPYQLFIIALAALVANGVSILISQYWAVASNISAQKVLECSLSIILFIALLLGVLSQIYSYEIVTILGATKILTADATSYFLPIAASVIFAFLLALISDIFRAQSNMASLLTIILVGAVANIILDFCFIVILKMGVSGAALATICAQLSAVVVGLMILNKDNHYFKLSSLRPRLDKALIVKILLLGFPVFISYFGASLVIMFVNFTISSQAEANSELLIGAYGIVSRINIFIILPLIAISYACQTIVAHNFGTKNSFRIKSALVVAIWISVGYLSFLTLLLALFDKEIFNIFTSSESLINYSIHIADAMYLLLPLSGICPICIAFFQATGKAKNALILSCAQIYLFLIPTILLISVTLEVYQLWYAYPIAQVLSLLLAWKMAHLAKVRPITQYLGYKAEEAK